MKKEAKQRKFHEALLKMLYPPPSPPSSDKDEGEDDDDDQAEANLIESFDGLPEEEIGNEEASLSHSDDNGSDGKLTRAQRKRLRKRKLKEGRRKIIGPLLPNYNDDVSNVAEGIRRNASANVSGDLSRSSVGVASIDAEGVRQNAGTDVSVEGEASCSNKNKVKLKQRRKSKRMAVAAAVAESTPSSTSNQNQEPSKVIVDDRVDEFIHETPNHDQSSKNNLNL